LLLDRYLFIEDTITLKIGLELSESMPCTKPSIAFILRLFEFGKMCLKTLSFDKFAPNTTN
jgi:hypothetical protein